jgi:ABC-type branched-subunit amino acid transport system ATPase component
MKDLGRINLLVGTNNCGKTSALEAVHFLMRASEPWVLWSTLSRRGEDLPAPRASRNRTMDVSHLFEGHELEFGSTFVISGLDDGQNLKFTANIVAPPTPGVTSTPQSPSFQQDIFDSVSVLPAARSGLAIELQWSGSEAIILPLTQGGGLDIDRIGARARLKKTERDDVRAVEFITTAALNEEETISALEEIVLTDNEDILIRALRSVEPGIERIAPVGSARRYGELGGRGGVAVKLSGTKSRIPLGSMGDGMWRMLGIALSLVRAKGGVLLIDEIDTGLHYTVMEQMWRLVHDAAKRLDVQVFAATHSRDCYQSLATIVQDEQPPKPEITIQRIERGNPCTVAFTDDEIKIAAEARVEVR